METQLVWDEASEEGLRRTLREHRHRGLTRRYLVTGRDNEVLNPKKKGMRWVPSAGHPATVTLDVPTDRGRVSSRKYGRTAADALPKPRCGMRCLDEPKLEQDEGH
jgi:hypothetical protein